MSIFSDRLPSQLPACAWLTTARSATLHRDLTRSTSRATTRSIGCVRWAPEPARTRMPLRMI